jgi:hypothetical protein
MTNEEIGRRILVFIVCSVGIGLGVKKHREANAAIKRIKQDAEFQRQADAYITAVKYVAYKRANGLYDDETYDEQVRNDLHFIGIMKYNFS